jgi:nucleoside-diphosphate-sugar epimerase
VSQSLSKVLITGASGFLGRHVLTALRRVQPAATPLALVRDPAVWAATGWQQNLGPIASVTGGIEETASWSADPQLDGLDGIFHLAGVVHHSRHDPEAMIRTNVEGTLAMVRLAAERRCRLIWVSTSGTVGCFRDPQATADEDAPYVEQTVGGWPYYRSKIQAEKAARQLAAELGVEMVIIRPPVLLGPGDDRYRSSSNVIRLLRGRVPFMLQGGMHFVDIRDVATAMVRAMAHPSPQPIYHLTGTASTLPDFFRLTGKVAGIPVTRWQLPPALVRGLAVANQRLGKKALTLLPDPVVIEMAAHYWGLTSRHAAQDLGYASRPPEETLADTIAWLRQHHPLLAPAGAAPASSPVAAATRTEVGSHQR